MRQERNRLKHTRVANSDVACSSLWSVAIVRTTMTLLDRGKVCGSSLSALAQDFWVELIFLRPY